MNIENNSTSIILCVLAIFTLITGFWFFFKPPKKINMFFGYRTKNSMKSQKHWDFAHTYSGKLFIFYGIILLFFAVMATFININHNIINIPVIILCIIGIIFIIRKTETSIHKKFDQ